MHIKLEEKINWRVFVSVVFLIASRLYDSEIRAKEKAYDFSKCYILAVRFSGLCFFRDLRDFK